MLKRIGFFISTWFATAVIARTPAIQPPVAMSTDLKTEHHCAKSEQPGRLATNHQLKTFGNEVNAYRDCMQAFAKAQGELAKQHTEIGNSAIREYNDYILELNKNKKAAAKQ